MADIASLYGAALVGFVLGLLVASLMQAAHLRGGDGIVFPDDPEMFDRFSCRGRTWVWSGSEWILTSIETRGKP